MRAVREVPERHHGQAEPAQGATPGRTPSAGWLAADCVDYPCLSDNLENCLSRLEARQLASQRPSDSDGTTATAAADRGQSEGERRSPGEPQESP